jgi:hypothetical protein
MTGWEAFGTGFATMLACANLFTLFALLLPSRQEGLAAAAAVEWLRRRRQPGKRSAQLAQG